jgi:acyl transferase domain-containing protein/3-hydroxymyristoyl/3-hydroxydecanoyl-(acyl carrier protein) dehydratase
MSFEPIAVVGRGCALPGALDPDVFWRNVAGGRVSLTPAPEQRWRAPRPLTTHARDLPLGEVGGFVHGFDEVFDPRGFQLPEQDVRALDASFQWVLHSARAALAEAGWDVSDGSPRPRGGLILGTLASPTASMALYGEHVWLSGIRQEIRTALLPGAPSGPAPDPRNRFAAGLCAQLAARAVGLGDGYGLEAACASSLYTIKLACDRLHDGSADLMLAGAFNGTDTLLLHLAFQEVSALSRSGRSRPFDRDADGLVPAQGAAIVALMRLSDALAEGVPVLGVLRGVGLSNDGRAGGLLTPDEDGQIRAMRLAYEGAGIAPESVSLVECHATGTALGDAAEVRSMRRFFGDDRDLAIGSVKANIGHTFAVAGLAGLLKMLGALATGVRPATPGLGERTEVLEDSGLRVLTEPELWTGPRRGAVSAFGFGGNNAHLIVEAWDPAASPAAARPARPAALVEVAVVAIGARVADGRCLEDFRRALLTGTAHPGPREGVEAALAGLRFPPRDLGRALAQQTLVLEAAREAAAQVRLPKERTAVLVGMGVDPEAARYGTRERLGCWLAAERTEADRERLADAFCPPLDAPGVLGTMPNLVVNRINTQLDLAGPSYAVLAEEASGVVALEHAARALRLGEADAALLGAVDLSCEPVHEHAAAALGLTAPSGDAAVVLVVKRAEDARRDGDRILALLPDPAAQHDHAEDAHRDGDPILALLPDPAAQHDAAGTEAAGKPDLAFGTDGFDTATLFGAAHAARGLVDVAAAVLALHHQAVPRADGPARPALDARTAQVRVGGICTSRRILLRAEHAEPWLPARPPRPYIYSGADKAAAAAAAAEDRRSDAGPARLVILADGPEQLGLRRSAAIRWLAGRGLPPAGVAFREQPVTGEVAFVYAGGISAYPEMGADLLLAFPEAPRQVTGRPGLLRAMAAWAHDRADEGREVSVADRIWGSGVLACVHTAVSRDVLGLRPDAVLGYSAGEATSLVALGIWSEDVAEHVAELNESGMFSREVAGEFRAVRRVREREGLTGAGWATYIVGATEKQAREALDGEPAVHLVAINAPESVVVGGEPAGCERVLRRLASAYAVRVPYDLAVHVPEANEVRDLWRRLNHRATEPIPGARLYTCGDVASYQPTPDACADALTSQAMGTMDFAGTVELAWEQGARVFVEHGPRRLCTDWIGATLAGRDHVAVALDDRLGGEVSGAAKAVAELLAAGVPIDADAFFDGLAEGYAPAQPPARTVSLPTRFPVVALPDLDRDRKESPDPAPLSRNSPDTGASPLPGPKFDRAQLEYAAVGRLSELFGPLFAAQDDYRRQTRMPAPPMLLADRVTGIDAEPATMGTGKIWTETDVKAEDWFLDYSGRMPVGLMMEAGQADLLLISWLGADLLSRGERVYRLLGCEVTLHGPVARVGETLRFEISIDGHAENDGVRLFFFRYDCYVGDELRLTVRSGQAGFFTDAELAESDGIRWDPSAETPPDRRVDPPPLRAARSFGPRELGAFADGRPADCFGPAWSATEQHVRTPRIGDGRMLFLDEVADFDPEGGPWGRGYLRARTAVDPEDWFFAGHFFNDPCMPGTLMFEGCFQAMSFYLAGLGATVEHDGWRFEPMRERGYRMRCRGQVTPNARELVYEVLVKEVHLGEEPLLIADLLCTVDGLKAFHAAEVGLRLIPDA